MNRSMPEALIFNWNKIQWIISWWEFDKCPILPTHRSVALLFLTEDIINYLMLWTRKDDGSHSDRTFYYIHNIKMILKLFLVSFYFESLKYFVLPDFGCKTLCRFYAEGNILWWTFSWYELTFSWCISP